MSKASQFHHGNCDNGFAYGQIFIHFKRVHTTDKGIINEWHEANIKSFNVLRNIVKWLPTKKMKIRNLSICTDIYIAGSDRTTFQLGSSVAVFAIKGKSIQSAILPTNPAIGLLMPSMSFRLTFSANRCLNIVTSTPCGIYMMRFVYGSLSDKEP